MSSWDREEKRGNRQLTCYEAAPKKRETSALFFAELKECAIFSVVCENFLVPKTGDIDDR